jgi:hypothetical protein
LKEIIKYKKNNLGPWAKSKVVKSNTVAGAKTIDAK